MSGFFSTVVKLVESSRKDSTSAGFTHLQLPAGLLVPLHERQFGAKAPEVHVVHHVGPLGGHLVHRLEEEEMAFVQRGERA